MLERTRSDWRPLFDERPGSWMFHCRILGHADLAMMGMSMLR